MGNCQLCGGDVWCLCQVFADSLSCEGSTCRASAVSPTLSAAHVPLRTANFPSLFRHSGLQWSRCRGSRSCILTYPPDPWQVQVLGLSAMRVERSTTNDCHRPVKSYLRGNAERGKHRDVTPNCAVFRTQHRADVNQLRARRDAV